MKMSVTTTYEIGDGSNKVRLTTKSEGKNVLNVSHTNASDQRESSYGECYLSDDELIQLYKVLRTVAGE